MKHNQNGAINALLAPLIISIILLIAAVSIGIIEYNNELKFVNNVKQEIAAAVNKAVNQESTAKNLAFAQAEKYPLATFQGPSSFGSLFIKYPKTWSAYIDDTGNGSALVNAYFDPNFVPSINSQNSVYALRVQLINNPYSQQIQQFTGLQQAGKTTITPYSLPKLPNIVGIKVSGVLPNSKTGEMVVLPLRTSTLEIYTEGSLYLNDFNNNVLPHFSFSP